MKSKNSFFQSKNNKKNDNPVKLKYDLNILSKNKNSFIQNMQNLKKVNINTKEKEINNAQNRKNRFEEQKNKNNIRNQSTLNKLNNKNNIEKNAKISNGTIGLGNIENTYYLNSFNNKENINTKKKEINNVENRKNRFEEEKNKNYMRNQSTMNYKKLINKNNTEKKAKFSNGAIGLENIGNTCYLNSALQNLKNTFLLTEYLLTKYHSFDANGFTIKYSELVANLINQEENQYYCPNKFHSKLSELAPMFKLGQQNDSNFTIIFILNLLEKETKLIKPIIDFKSSKKFTENERIIFEQFKNKILEKRNSPIIDFFYGCQEDIFKCENCHNLNNNFQLFNVLNLSIINQKDKKIYSLQDAIKYYQTKQIHINEKDFCCSNCNEKNISTQSLLICLPKILIINLKRIGEGNNFYNHNLNIPMILNMEELIENGNYYDNKYEYELTGFIKHLGGAYSGHNIAICKNFFDDFWYEFNDSKVSSIQNSSYYNYNHYNKNNMIDTSNSFLYFYKRKDLNIKDDKKKLIEINSSKMREF